MCDVRRRGQSGLIIKAKPEGGRVGSRSGALLGKARVVPRCPGVSPGRSRGGRHLGPVGRVALPRGAPVTPGRRQAALSRGVRPKRKKMSVFNDFLVFFG